MKQLLAAIALVTPLVFGQSAMAENAQQSKMTSCNQEAAGKKGDERKAFMKECLSSKPTVAMTPQKRMGMCNADAKGKKGDERKAFMKACLKKDPA